MAALPSYISVSHEIMLGKPTVCGARLTVELVLRKRSEGATAADLLQIHPLSEAADVEASLRYAAAEAIE